MMLAFFPVKKLRRNRKYLLFGAILLIGALAVYHEMVAAKAWASDSSMNLASNWKTALFDEKARRSHHPDYVVDSASWKSSYTPQTWKPEYKGRANLHIFEDWCGSSTADMRKNPHFPLYPHSRTTVQKLAISPQWTNYGLRIFGYLHPYTDGEFVFALSSDDNSELWLSTDDSPLNLQLLVWVGKTGKEWTAPGEFEKYASQTSRPIRLSTRMRYFFEVIHKQNDKGTDHVEVAWKLLDQGFVFKVIESKHISLYVDESAFLMSDVVHIPQTAASHQHMPTKQYSDTADMVREDPRDTFYQVPLINSKFLHGVLPDCSYQPSYTIKDFPLLRYQGLQFVHLSYIYPNDYTRLTHMESGNTCFYSESSYYIRMFGFSRYMKLDRPNKQGKAKIVRDFGFHGRKSNLDEVNEFDNEAYQREKEAKPDQMDNDLLPDYGDDYDDYAQKRRRKLFSLVMKETNNTKLSASDTRQRIGQLKRRRYKGKVPQLQPEPEIPAVRHHVQETSKHQMHLPQNQTDLKQEGPIKEVEQIKSIQRQAVKQEVKSVKTTLTLGQTNTQSIPMDREQLKVKEQGVVPSGQLSSDQRQRSRKMNQTSIQRFHSLESNAALPEKPTVATQGMFVTRQTEDQPIAKNNFTTQKRNTTHSMLKQKGRDKLFRGKEIEINMPLQQDIENGINRGKRRKNWSDTKVEKNKVYNKAYRRRGTRDSGRISLWGQRGDLDGDDDEDLTPAPVYDTEVNWNQTFQVKPLDLQTLRSDRIDLQCNISGNLLLHSSDVLPVVKAFMDKLNEKHNQQFTLVRVVNVVKRVDGAQGSRYLLELELKDVNDQLVRLSQYIYTLIPYSRQRSKDFRRPKPEFVLCNPVGFHWNPHATVHFIVPVKNQARWVLQLIADMEELFRETGDTNFNLIITDYNSTDMDVRKALEKSSLPRYEYVKLSGNFERSAGLQAGINYINDDHSIVFLCDLHIHFPPSIIDTIRKHCVEGYMAFAPILMRLDCGATPLEARGYWEVNGFGLLGIYKSDLEAVGGMNTKEFKDRWGGEDWELLDRILQAGLEVERIYLRNFFHNYHSKRGMWNRRMSTSHR